MSSPVASGPLATRALARPRLRGDVSVEEAIAHRESVGEFSPQLLHRAELSQLLWVAQGITRDWGARSVPSAGALYPLELYLVTAEGVFHYLPAGHRLDLVAERDARSALSRAAFARVSRVVTQDSLTAHRRPSLVNTLSGRAG